MAAGTILKLNSSYETPISDKIRMAIKTKASTKNEEWGIDFDVILTPLIRLNMPPWSTVGRRGAPVAQHKSSTIFTS